MIFKGNNIYAVNMALTSLMGGVGVDTAFDLQIAGRQARLKSILFDVQFREWITNVPLLWHQNTTQDISLEIGSLGAVGGANAKVFSNFVPVPAFVNHGNYIVIHRPVQLFFDHWFFSNELHFNYHSLNWDLLHDYYHNLSITVEIDPL